MRKAKFRYAYVAVGGTFDHLHAGHERLLSKAFELGETVFVGISANQLVSRLNKKHRIRPFRVRARDLRRFLKSRGWSRRSRIVELKERFGPAVRRKRLGALIVSEETKASGRKVNSLRRQSGLPVLRIYVVKPVLAEDGLPVSTTRIIRGEIDYNGKLLA